MRGSKYKIKLSNTERKDLEKIVRSHNAPQKLVRRAKIILLADDGLNYYVIAQVLSIQDKIVTTWVKRWLKTTDKELSIIDRLLDLPRPGAPDKFTPEQICQIITIACEKPEIYGRPITNWTNRELADEVIKQGIVESISERHIGRILERFELHPHKSQYWLNCEPDKKKNEKINNICELYHDAIEINNRNELLMSVDEKTSIQATERKASTLPMKPGFDERIEFYYKRHGTQTLIAGLNVAIGNIIGKCIDTRTETDFVNFIDTIIKAHQNQVKYHFIVDNLNIHKSESLVKYVAEQSNTDEDLGIKGTKGILKSMETRETFLTNKEHK